jgi:undecaprenyl-diphosphatase
MIKILHDNSAMNMLMVSLSFLGDTSSLLFFAIVLTIIRRTRRVGMIYLCSILIIVVSAMYIKIVVGRELPPSFSSSFDDDSRNLEIEPEAVSHLAKNLSYPSTHVAIAACLAYVVRARLGTRHRILVTGIWFYPIFMAISRLYILQYYVTDIAGGFLLGLVIAISMSNIIQVEAEPK